MNRVLKATLAALILLLALACGGQAPNGAPAPPVVSPVFAVETLQSSGTPGNRINLVLLGDGYTQQDQDKLTRDAQSWLATFNRTPPYGNYASYFNIKLVHVVSQEDGADNGSHGFGVMRSTALGASFQNASPAGQPADYRLLVVDNALAQAMAVAHAPECTKVLVLVNDSNYGGSGGAVPVFSMHPESCLIALHEFGHSFGGLADEYACGDTSPLPGALEAFPNVTALQALDQVKWKGWIEVGTPLPTPDVQANATQPGLFEGAYYHDRGVYRPRHTCRMRSLYDGFCEVCAEAIVRGVYGRVRLIDGSMPAGPVQVDGKSPLTLSISHPLPNPNTLQLTWTVDGAAVSGGADSLTLPAGTLEAGPHDISVQLYDATPLVRNDRERLILSHTWSVTVGGGPAPAPRPADEKAEHLLLRVVQDASGFRVVDRTLVPLPLPLEPGQGPSSWQVNVLGSDGGVLLGRWVEDPTLLRGEFQNAADRGRTDGYRLSGKGPASFLLRLPLVEARQLEIYEKVPGNPEQRLLGRAALTDTSAQ